MNWPVRTASSVLLLVLVSVASADSSTLPAPDPASLRGESIQTRKRLAEAEQKLLTNKPTEATDDLQRIIDECPDDLITIDGRQFQTARWVCHSILAKLPPDALKSYRDRIDEPAKKLLDQAKRERDPRPLWQLLDRYFVSRPADEAILLLGDMLFERGEFRTAETLWRRLIPNANADSPFPGSKTDPALVRARIVLATIFQNDSERAKAEFATFQEKHPTATGTLAGKTGPLVNTLKAFLNTTPKLPPDVTSGTSWSTYGGGPHRTSRVPGGIPSWPSRPSHSESFGRQIDEPLSPNRSPFGYPAIIDNEVFVANGSRILSYELLTGKPSREEYKLNDEQFDANCTLTAAGDYLYARLDSSVTRPHLQQNGKLNATSALYCLSLKTDGQPKLLWKLSPPEDGKAVVEWEGAPLVSGRRLWAVYRKFEGGRITHVAVCYDPADTENRPLRPTWIAELCDSPQTVAGSEKTRQELLTLAGENIVFCSNNGAVVAVDALTGHRAWGFRYHRSRKATNNETNNPAPAVAFGGRVFVAPTDGERVYALDAITGRLVWESGPTEGAEILGIARNRLIVTVTGPLRSIRGLNLNTGSYRDGGWVQHSGRGVLGYGHGFVTDDVIVWPSREGLFFLDPEDGVPLYGVSPNPLHGPNGERQFGHVAYANGVLVVVTPSQLWFYRAESRKIKTRPDAPAQNQFNAMIERAEHALAKGHPDQAQTILAEVATGDLPPPFRAWAAARLLQLAPTVREPSQLPQIVRDALQPTIMTEWIFSPEGVPVTLEAFLQRHLGRSPTPISVPVAAANRKPGVSELSPSVEIDRASPLPLAVAPLRVIEGGACPPKRIFAAGPRVVVAVPLDRSPETKHTAADLFTHAADLQDGFVAAGPFAIAVYGFDREPVWVFRVPPTERLPPASSVRLWNNSKSSYPHLSSFVLVGSWLLARIGEHHLIALDLQARRVVWVLGASGRAGYQPNLFPGAATFGPHFAVCGKFAIVQLSGGRRWFVALATGRFTPMPALGEQTALTDWLHTPSRVGDDHLLLSDGSGLVRFIQIGGRVKWAFEPESDEGFTGEPAQVRVWEEVLCSGEHLEQFFPKLDEDPTAQSLKSPLLLVAVRRNHGVEVERVNMADGKSAWSRGPVFLDTDHINLHSAAASDECAYIPAANKLLAVKLTSGKMAWEAKLPEGGARGWVVHVGKNCVFAHPAEAVPAESMDVVWNRLVRSFHREPFAWRLPGLAGTLYEAWIDRTVPVLVFDPESGKRVARINIPARGPVIATWFDSNNAVIATGDRVVWLK